MKVAVRPVHVFVGIGVLFVVLLFLLMGSDSTTTIINNTINQSSNATSLWNESGDSIFPYDLNKNVSIGKTDAEYNLDVKGQFRVTSPFTNEVMLLESAGSSSFISIADDLYFNQYLVGLDSGSFVIADETYSTYPIVMEEGVDDYTLYLESDDEVGIGTDSPGAKLDVHGNVTVSAGNDFCVDAGRCLEDMIDGTGFTSHLAYYTDGNTISYDYQDLSYDPTTNSMGIGYITTTWGALTVESQTDNDNIALKENAAFGAEYFSIELTSAGDMSFRTDSNVVNEIKFDDDGDSIYYQEIGFQGYDAGDNMGIKTGGIGQGQGCIPSTPYTVKDFDHTLYCCTPEANLQVNLPALRDQNFRELEFKIIDETCQITIDPYSTDKIEGASTYVLSGIYNAVEIHCFDDRTYGMWYITGAYGLG